jgi:hypothetical protein
MDFRNSLVKIISYFKTEKVNHQSQSCKNLFENLRINNTLNDKAKLKY